MSEMQRVPVRGCLRDRIGRDVASRPGAVFDDDRLRQRLRRFLSHDSRDGIDAAARREPDGQPDRAIREVILRARERYEAYRRSR
jgi:hypothetical protein